MKKYTVFAIIIMVLAAGSQAAQSDTSWDSSRYIRVDEVKTDMQAYALTVLKGDIIEKIDLKILSVIKNIRPGKTRILVVSTDPRMKEAGAIHGCSGSPVYINERMAGALSAGWDGSLEPVYMVTPIEDMLPIGLVKTPALNLSSGKTKCYVESCSSINLDSIARLAADDLQNTRGSEQMLPLSTNLSQQACKALEPELERAGLVPVQSGISAGISSNSTLEPGGVMVLPLCYGDIQLSVSGTVTEVVGDKVYGFGHAFTSIGALELPMSSGTIHSIIATRTNSFKLSSPGPVLGTLYFDHEDGVVGQIGRRPDLIDLQIKINRYDDSQTRVFNCKVAKDRQLTPLILRSASQGAALNQGDLPPEHNVRYRCSLYFSGGQKLEYENFSSNESIQAPVMNLFALTSALLNNPFQFMMPTKVSLEIDIQPGSRIATLQELRLSDNTVRPGGKITVYFKVKEFRTSTKEYSVDFEIPADCPVGRHSIQVCGADGYQGFLQKNAPQKFLVTDAESLLKGLGMILNIPADKIYVCMTTSTSGISIRNAELANLPQTKTSILADSKRIQPMTPYQNFIETSIPADFVLNGAAAADMIVEQNP